MKYIKTKYGTIAEITKDCGEYVKYKTGKLGGLIRKTCIVKTTDDVKKLLDETMFLYKGKRYKCIINTDVWGHRFVRFEKVVHHVKKYPHTTVETVNMKVATAFKKGIVYGSIWAGLDLKAVTQMNEKGDWVLL